MTTPHLIHAWDQDSSTCELRTLLKLMDTCSSLNFSPDFYLPKNEEVLTGVQSGKYVMYLSVEHGLSIDEVSVSD